VLLPLLLYLREHKASRVLGWAAHWASSPLRIYWMALPLYIYEAFVEPFFPPSNALMGDWFNLASSGTLFLYGFVLLCVGHHFWPMLQAHKQRFLWTGIIAFSLMLFVKFNFEDGPLVHFIEAIFKTVNLWSWLMAILAYGAAWLNRPSAFLAYSNRAVYPFYILHQTVTIVLAYALKPFALPFFLKFGLLCAGTLLVCYMLYELLMKAGLGMFLGVKAGEAP
jgi:hypothetical protein